MTTLDVAPDLLPVPERPPVAAAGTAAEPQRQPRSITAARHLSGRRVGTLAAAWLVMVLVCITLVAYGLEPVFVDQTQDRLLESYRAQITTSANETQGLPGISVPTKAPEPGTPVGIIEIGAIQMRQVAVEGISSSQTQGGPGHVPGTAGPGQPGNSALVGRRGAFGGAFGPLDQLEPDDTILMTTTQGQVVYKVVSITQTAIREPSTAVDGASSPPTTQALSTDEAIDPEVAAAATATPVGPSVDLDVLFGPTDDDRLTLVTSASAVPWNTDRALVVVAAMEGRPFVPSPQGGRTDSSTSISGDPSAWSPFLLALFAFATAAIAAVLLYRRSSARSAYLLTTPPLIVFVILATETGFRLLPSWT